MFAAIGSPAELDDDALYFIDTGKPLEKEIRYWAPRFHDYISAAAKLAYYDEYMGLKQAQQVEQELEP